MVERLNSLNGKFYPFVLSIFPNSTTLIRLRRTSKSLTRLENNPLLGHECKLAIDMDFSKTCFCLGLASAILFCTGGTGIYRINTRQTDAADRLVHLSRNELKALLGLNSRGGSNILPIDNKQYKCQILDTLYSYWRLNFKNSPEKDLLTERVTQMLADCGSPNFRIAEFFNQTFIFPGTKWCGQANVAENYHDLGVFNETDSCCRDHDFCEDIIQSGRTKYNLVNPYGTTRLHCKCDAALRRCFKKVNSVISNTVGYIFFSLLQTQCFDLEYPTSGCELWRRGAVRLYCVKYRLQKDKPKRWQWFDQEPYF